MMRSTTVVNHRGGRIRGFLLSDPGLKLANSGSGFRSLKRMGAAGVSKGGRGIPKVGHVYGNSQYQHAFPLLTHDDLGNSDQSNNTKHIELSMYMPKRNKGTAPWWRGADTYSLKYTEQSRFEYQRYLMINRFPSEYKKHFISFLSNINAARQKGFHIPQEALHWLQRMVVDNFNPQHIHYISAMDVLMLAGELDMARDVWKMMERQQTWPTNATICAYLDVCIAAKELSWGLECWNRYCTEQKFLQEGEVDPKPVSRAPFSLTREELLYLPKWKKHFDHDPNLDVVDLNRFNITRELYAKMAILAAVCEEHGLFEQFLSILEEKLVSTPTPIPEPPNPHVRRRPQWGPHLVDVTTRSAWRAMNSNRFVALGETTAVVDDLSTRFASNQQFLLDTLHRVIAGLTSNTNLKDDEAVIATCEKLFERIKKTLGGPVYANLATDSLFLALSRLYIVRGKYPGQKVYEKMNALSTEKAKLATEGKDSSSPAVGESLHTAVYQSILDAFAEEASRKGKTFSPHKLMQQVALLSKEISSSNTGKGVWTAAMHRSVVACLVHCGTMKANDYFVKNVLRQFEWDSAFLEVLYLEYRRHDDIDMWAELTKRALVWTARYNVTVSETLKRLIENDYAVIGVHTRSMKELAIFQFRDVEEKRHARNPVNQLPNPWIDHVSHALPFPDRDVGYPNEYGEIGQWRAPGGPGSPTKGPGYFAPTMEGEHLKGYTSEWRDLKNPMRPSPFPSPWDRKYAQYARGQHPSYDMTYAGPMPEIFPQRTNFRKPTRWDYHDVEKQGKFKISGAH